MKKQTQEIIVSLKDVLTGHPWYGQSVISILETVDPSMVYEKPGGHSHSVLDLLYHMNTWTAFTVKRLEKDMTPDHSDSEQEDWRTIDPMEHTLQKGLASFKSLNDTIIKLLEVKDSDDFLDETVDFRNYNFRYLLNGLIQHHIYHLGQIAYVMKLMVK